MPCKAIQAEIVKKGCLFSWAWEPPLLLRTPVAIGVNPQPNHRCLPPCCREHCWQDLAARRVGTLRHMGMGRQFGNGQGMRLLPAPLAQGMAISDMNRRSAP